MSIFSILISNSQAKTCNSFFANPSPLNKVLEKNSDSKGNILLIHGLGDDLTHLQKLAENFKKEGYNVLRVDLHGHGKNLEINIQENKKLPDIIPYADNVRDISKIIKDLDFKNPIVIGHSYGAAIAYALTNNLKDSFLYQPKSLILMAPYLRRLDYASLTGNPWVDAHTEMYTEQFMRKNFRQYFESQKRKNVDLLIESAIATTKGIRNFDILSPHKNASLSYSIPFLVVAGSKDPLIKEDEIQNFHKKLSEENYKHNIVFLNGDHFFPYTAPKSTFIVINEFLNRL